MKKILKYLWIFLINIILILYLSELLTTIFLKTKVNMYVDIDYNRFQKAKELGIDFDTRTPFQAFIEEKNKEPNLSPVYYFNKTHLVKGGGSHPTIQKFIQSKIDNGDLLPFRGPINKKTLSCHEDGTRRLVNNDKNGFKNPNSIYKNKIEALLLGDSFAEGMCMDEKNDMAAMLRSKFGVNTANYGIGGAGPLLSLAALKEYGNNFKPKHVIYFYYEGNEMEDLGNEKKTFLINYLKNFNQNLINRNDEIVKFFIDYEKIALEAFEEITKGKEHNEFDYDVEEEIKRSKSREKIEILKDFVELQKLKSIFLTEKFFGHNNVIDKDLFAKVLNEMKLETENWDGKLIVVYLPAWNRFHQKYSFVHYFHKMKIGKIIKSLNIVYIDMAEEFERQEDPLNLFPFSLHGHYTQEGYQLVAEEIFKNINIK